MRCVESSNLAGEAKVDQPKRSRLICLWVSTVVLVCTMTLPGSEFVQAKGLGYEGLTAAQAELFQKVGNNLRCPTCTGLSVLQSEADFAVKIRETAREKVAQGQTEKEIMVFFTERYGLWILRKPPTRGFHLLAWGIPIAFVIIGPILLWLFVWRRKAVVSIDGIRPSHEILTEMETELEALKVKLGSGSSAKAKAKA